MTDELVRAYNDTKRLKRRDDFGSQTCANAIDGDGVKFSHTAKLR